MVIGPLSHVLQRGGDTDGGLSGVDIDVHVWNVHSCAADLPQKTGPPLSLEELGGQSL